jgi:DNA polymerase III alpha subunit
MDNLLLKELLNEMALMEVSSKGHIIEPFRDDLKKAGFVTSDGIKWKEHGSWIKAAGRTIIIHTPPTKSGKRVMFLTLEDEKGLFDLTVFEDVQRRYAKKILANAVLITEGSVNRFGLRGVCVVAKRILTIEEFYNGTIAHRDSIMD